MHQGDNPDPRSILVVLPTWVGDFVMATPALRAIRRRFSNAHITFLLEPNLRELVRGGDWMNECIEWPAKERRSPLYRVFRDVAWDLRRRRFDWAVLLPNSFRAALMVRFTGARRRIGYDRDGRRFLLTDRLLVKNRREHPTGTSRRRLGSPDQPKAAERSFGEVTPLVTDGATIPAPPGRYVPMPLVEYLADLAEAIGCERPGDRLELFTTPDCDETVRERLASLGIEDHQPLVVIGPGAKYGAAKCWPPERFAAAADHLIETEDAAVVITCGPGEASIAREIGSVMRGKAYVFDSPQLGLGELKSLIRRCDLLLCNDAGPRHFAKAFGVPVVTIFGPTHPDWTATSYAAERIVRVDVDCGPCQQRVCPLGHLECMTRVTVEAVVDAARGLLRSHVGQAAR